MECTVRMEPYILPVIARGAQMFSHNGYGPGTKDQGQRSRIYQQAPWALGLGARPISIMHKHVYTKGNQLGSNQQAIYTATYAYNGRREGWGVVNAILIMLGIKNIHDMKSV